MVLPTNGNPISFSNVQVEFALSGPVTASRVQRIGQANIPSFGNAISMSQLQEKSNSTLITFANASNNKYFVYDSTNDIVRLNLAENNTTNILCPYLVYNNSNNPTGNLYSNQGLNYEGAIALRNYTNSNYTRHTGLIIKQNAFGANSFDFTFQVIQSPLGSNFYYLRNAYGTGTTSNGVNGYLLGWDSNNDYVQVTNNSYTSSLNPKIFPWKTNLLAPSVLNVKPIAAMYAFASFYANDLKLSGKTTVSTVTNWGPYYAPATAPIFYSSGGYSNNAYVEFVTASSHYLANLNAFTINSSTNNWNSWLGIGNQPGFTCFMLMKVTDLTATSQWARFWECGNDSKIEISRLANSAEFRFTIGDGTNQGNVLNYATTTTAITANVWKAYAFRFNNTTLAATIYGTTTTLTNLSSALIGSATGGTTMPTYSISAGASSIGRSFYGDPYASMQLDSMYVCDNWMDDTTTLSTLNTMISCGTYQYVSTALFAFTSHTFTNAGATGRFGPTLGQCQSAYSSTSWANNASYFNMTTQGYQVWTVPQTGNYTITAAGAKGGNGAVTGFSGRIVSGTFALTSGQTLTIVVGQQGGDRGAAAGGGGGGGTFVIYGGSPLVVAGGGGGAGNNSNGSAGIFSPSGAGGGGSSGGTNMAAGGGGYTGNGTFSGSFNSGPGLSYTNDATGGIKYDVGGDGGFGGGAGGGGGNGWCAGGGGGYTGGDGAGAGYDSGGYGGTSYGTGISDGGLNGGQGYVTIVAL